MVQAYRLARGGRIDRSKPLAMRFNGEEIEALAGDTVEVSVAGIGVLRNPVHAPQA